MPVDANLLGLANGRQNPYDAADAAYAYRKAFTPNFQTGFMGMGMNAAQNMANSTMQGFGNAAGLSSANYQANVPERVAALNAQTRRYEIDAQNKRLKEISPLLASIFGGGGGGGGGQPSNFNTNYGAGVSYS